jgi:uncharacterized membrane protein YhaH (DUF805 family)
VGAIFAMTQPCFNEGTSLTWPSMAKETISRAIFGTFGKIGVLFYFISIILLNAIAVLSFLYSSTPRAIGISGVALFISVLLLVFVMALFSLTFHKASSSTFWMLVALFEISFVLIHAFFISRYEIHGLHTEDGVTTNDKWDALYFSIITWTTTGYGDLVPIGTSRWFACSEALLGTVFHGIVLASVIYHLNLMAKPKQ